MNKKASALANYLENSGLILGSSDSHFGKTVTLSVTLPIERYCLLKELSSRFNSSMTQLVNTALNGFDKELFLSFSDSLARSIAIKVDEQICNDVDDVEHVYYWLKELNLDLERRDFEDFCKLNSHLDDYELSIAYDEYKNRRDGEY